MAVCGILPLSKICFLRRTITRPSAATAAAATPATDPPTIAGRACPGTSVGDDINVCLV